MGQCTYAKDLWLTLEDTYQRKKEYLENNSIKKNEGKDLQKPLIALFLNVILLAKRKILNTFQMKEKKHVIMLEKRNILKTFQLKVKNLHSQTLDYNSSKCDDVEFFSTSEE
jgi:hypothetical protein